MIAKKMAAVMLLLLILTSTTITLLNGRKKGRSFPVFNEYYQVSEYMNEVEHFFLDNFPLADRLRTLSVEVQMKGGERQFQQIYIGDDILVENIGFPDEKITKNNMNALTDFVEQSRISTNLMIIPTKCAIKQNEIPPNAPLFNQKQFIEQTYNEMLGKVTAIDVYPTLFSKMDQYSFYRSSPELTSLGAYSVYEVLAGRLGHSPWPQESFQIQHLTHNFYGITYEDSPYKKITPDVITLYRYKKNNRSYTVTHNEDYTYTYPTLYPTQLLQFDEDLNVFLGGDTGDITIRSNSQNDSSLLVIGDESILPVLPFLMAHYSQIRFLDLSKWSKEAIATIQYDQYQRLLVSYSVDTLIHSTSPAKLRYLKTNS